MHAVFSTFPFNAGAISMPRIFLCGTPRAERSARYDRNCVKSLLPASEILSSIANQSPFSPRAGEQGLHHTTHSPAITSACSSTVFVAFSCLSGG